MAKEKSKKAQVIELLTLSGFVPAGTTRVESVRIPTTRCPVYGHGPNPPGGEVTTFGGRLRFARGDNRVTVGSFTTSFYRIDPSPTIHPAVRRAANLGGPENFHNFRTQDLEGIKLYLGTLQT